MKAQNVKELYPKYIWVTDLDVAKIQQFSLLYRYYHDKIMEPEALYFKESWMKDDFFVYLQQNCNKGVHL